MNKFLSEWKQRELLCPAIASSPPPSAVAPLSSSTTAFPSFLHQFSASGLTASAAAACEFESRCANLTTATPTDGLTTTSQFPAATSALLAAALAQQNNNSAACTQISAEDQLGAFLAAAVAANSSAAAAASVNNSGMVADSVSGAASTDSGACPSAGANAVVAQSQHLTNSLASAVAGNPFLSQPPHQSAFQLVRSAHQVVPHSLLQPNPLLQQPQASPQNPPPEIRIHQPQPIPQEVTTSQHMAAAAAALYPQLMCQALLDRLGPSVLRSHMSAAKPIPNNERVDLARWRIKEPQEWAMDDVVAWMLDVAKRHQIPFENFQMHKFATCTGPLLMLMNEQSFKERDPTYGSLLFNEFRKLLNDDSFVDDWMRAYKASEEDVKPSTSALPAPKPELPHNPQNVGASLAIPQGSVTSINGFLAATSPLSPLLHSMQQQQQAAMAAAAAASLEPQPGPSSAPLQPHPSPLSYTLLQHPSAARQQEMARSPGGNLDVFPASVASTSTNCDDDDGDDAIYHGVNAKIRKNKDGRPRKRSQHTKGNKLWEFIRDALKDPTTCPSVVRWEDPVQGVFRIVESEKLARLWGERKNNQKMTYEKLSRAMRTYYEKQILVPVPKTGLYPKKLVYKFGPGAHGWSAPPDLVAAAVAANLMEERAQHHF